MTSVSQVCRIQQNIKWALDHFISRIPMCDIHVRHQHTLDYIPNDFLKISLTSHYFDFSLMGELHFLRVSCPQWFILIFSDSVFRIVLNQHIQHSFRKLFPPCNNFEQFSWYFCICSPIQLSGDFSLAQVLLL